MFGNSLFQKISIPDDASVVFVADMFVDEYVGGAELTSEALVSSSPFKVFKLKSSDVTIDTLNQGHTKFWIFGNFAHLNKELIPTIIGNMKYSVLEYDYKYCQARSPERHLAITGTPCDCHNMMIGKLISAFYYGAAAMWWMSVKQKERYEMMFPFLADKDSFVLSSVFSDESLGYIKVLREKYKTATKTKWIVLGSDSWIKGFNNAKKWCEDNKKDYDVVWNLPYNELLDRLAQSEGFVYLPEGGDTCPRMVIEAKLLGCKLHINDNVQHSEEDWFATDNLQEIEEYLYSAKSLFWNTTRNVMNYKPKISGYTTTYNCVKQEYPFEECITSMLQFCDEVCVVDGGSTDGTLDRLAALSSADDRLKFKVIERDWNHPRSAVFDGMQKAEARKMCTGEFCWQMDSDEVVHEDNVQKIIDLCHKMPKDIELISLPVVEYWGSDDKVRVDVLPWKWRLSRNKSYITHGIPGQLRKFDSDGNLCAVPGTDGCDLIHSETLQPFPHLNFYTPEADKARRDALAGDKSALEQYSAWFNSVVENIPGVFHYSWHNIERKIKLYRDFWTRHWHVLYGNDYKDTAETNMMFDVPWSEVTDEMIKQRAEELKKTGGHIWHTKWDGKIVSHISVNKTQPTIMVKK